MKKPQKGEYGYHAYQKKRKLLFSILSMFAVLVIYLTGIFLYHTNKSIYTVIAILAVLPAARILVSYIVLFPFSFSHSEEYQKLAELAGEHIFCDFILSSSDKFYPLDFIYISGGRILCYSDSSKISEKEYETYLKNVLERGCSYSSLKVYKEFSVFYRKIQELEAKQPEMDRKAGDEKIAHILSVFSL